MINLRGFAYFTAVLCFIIWGLAVNHAYPRDLDGRYAASPNKAWFDSLASGKGPCCSDADGTAVLDADWASVTNTVKPNVHYMVRVERQWVDVPDDAVLTVPNRDGRTIVWPMHVDGAVVIRCFIPGTMG